MANNNFEFVQPRFGILRNLSSAKTKKLDLTAELDDLWKHDEYIHALQFQKQLLTTLELVAPTHPKAPNGLIAAIHKKSAENYQEKLRVYEDAFAKYSLKLANINKQNELITLFQAIKKKYKYTCCFCGFEDPGFIEVHHINGNHHDNSPDNLQTACILCHRQHHLLWLSVHDHAQLGAANAVYINQAELNHLQRICLVYSQDSGELGAILGRSGKLGHMLEQLANGFSRPLHAFMMPEAEKLKIKNDYRSKVKLRYPPTGREENIDVICQAIDALETPLPNQNQLSDIGKLDALIGAAELKKNEPNSTEEQLRLQALNSVREAIAKYERDYEAAFELSFMNKTETFSIFELAMSLKTISVEDYKAFNPKHLFLVFKDGIFTEEQIAAYKKMDYFDTKKWSYGNN